jgi:2-amino-4-hydroxy-6-hydroxymethyldihydropteridine diphosphokinase
MTEVFIGVGSNIAPEEHLVKALRTLQHHVAVIAVATVYRTSPIGRPEQKDYLNTVWQIRTEHTPHHVKFNILRPIEASLGRVRSEDVYAARSIDLDILLYGDMILYDADLILPDPDIRTRPFLAIPLLELAPGLLLPDTREPLQHVVVAFGQTELIPVPHITQQLQRTLAP